MPDVGRSKVFLRFFFAAARLGDGLAAPSALLSAMGLDAGGAVRLFSRPAARAVGTRITA